MLLCMRLYGVRNLNEMGGRFYVHIRCNACKRRNCYSATALLMRFPLHKRIDASLDALKGRLVCTCGSRNATVWAMADPMEFDAGEFDYLIDFTGADGAESPRD
jgi:hypothetical protein